MAPFFALGFILYKLHILLGVAHDHDGISVPTTCTLRHSFINPMQHSAKKCSAKMKPGFNSCYK